MFIFNAMGGKPEKGLFFLVWVGVFWGF